MPGFKDTDKMYPPGRLLLGFWYLYEIGTPRERVARILQKVGNVLSPDDRIVRISCVRRPDSRPVICRNISAGTMKRVMGASICWALGVRDRRTHLM